MTFLWLACHDHLSTKSQLLKRHIVSDDSCPFCHVNPKTTIHVLRDCPSILPIWKELSNHALRPEFLTSNLPDWLKLMSTASSKTPVIPNIPCKITFPLAVWSIWSARNKFVMEA